MPCSIKHLTDCCSTDGQELLVALPAGAIGMDVGPQITSPHTLRQPLELEMGEKQK